MYRKPKPLKNIIVLTNNYINYCTVKSMTQQKKHCTNKIWKTVSFGKKWGICLNENSKYLTYFEPEPFEPECKKRKLDINVKVLLVANIHHIAYLLNRWKQALSENTSAVTTELPLNHVTSEVEIKKMKHSRFLSPSCCKDMW